jgi:hypothetical protein
VTAVAGVRVGSRSAKGVFLAAVAAVLIAGSGCGHADMAKVSGTVTFKGQPVRMANVLFMPQKRPMAGGLTDKEGRFSLTTRQPRDGAFVGPHKVVVVPWLPGVGDDPKNSAAADIPPADRADIPTKFRTRESSPLTAEVVAGKPNEFTFELEK